ncbi:Crystal protein ET79 [Rhodococcus ruber]|nr:Crystal protein ET79 [Rhodococcus ruber]
MKKMFPEGLPVSAAGYRMTAISGTGNICQNKYEVFEG